MRISDPKNITMGFDISELDIETFMKTRKGLSAGTIVTRKSRIRIFLAWLNETHNIITPRVIEEFFYYLQMEKGLVGTSLNTYITALWTLESYLIDRKLSKRFMKGFKHFKTTDPDVIPLSVEEIKALKKGWIEMRNTKIARMYLSITIFLADTGARWEEAQDIRCKSVDIIGQQISYVQLKTGARRNVHIEEPLLSILSEQIKNKELEEHVFTNSHGGTVYYPDYYQYLKKLKKSVGITKRVSPHILRHSYAQNLYDQTGDIYLVQAVLGHRNINSTLRYLRNSGKRVKLAQQMHPHLAEYVDPLIRVEVIEKELEKSGIELDDRFDRLKVKKAINAFMIALTDAMRPSSLS